MRLGFFFLFFTISFSSFPNDSLLIPKLFQNLLNKQVTNPNFFVNGSFPSYRQHSNNNKLRHDNNIFYTALIAYTLQELKPYLTNDESIIADTIINRAAKAFPHYKNASGRLSYNFWQTQSGGSFFPNDKVLSKMKKKLALPDDLDDTGIILSALNIDDSTAAKAHLLMRNFANGKHSIIKNTYKEYKNTNAYSTWYGVKMPVDFDFGVHCNILTFVNKYHLPWQKEDSATYNLLLNMIDKKLYLKAPAYISPYYCYTPVLLYHIARLSSTKQMAAIEERKPALIADIFSSFNQTEDTLYKIILSSTLLKWNIAPPNLELGGDVASGSLNTTDFVYYTGHLFSHLNNSIKKIANVMDATQYKWYCSGFNDCLALEYLILKHRKRK